MDTRLRRMPSGNLTGQPGIPLHKKTAPAKERSVHAVHLPAVREIANRPRAGIVGPGRLQDAEMALPRLGKTKSHAHTHFPTLA